MLSGSKLKLDCGTIIMKYISQFIYYLVPKESTGECDKCLFPKLLTHKSIVHWILILMIDTDILMMLITTFINNGH